MQLIGYYRGFQSQRYISWRCADRLSHVKFLGRLMLVSFWDRRGEIDARHSENRSGGLIGLVAASLRSIHVRQSNSNCVEVQYLLFEAQLLPLDFFDASIQNARLFNGGPIVHEL